LKGFSSLYDVFLEHWILGCLFLGEECIERIATMVGKK